MVPAFPMVSGGFPWLVVIAALVLATLAGVAVALLEARTVARRAETRIEAPAARRLDKAA